MAKLKNKFLFPIIGLSIICIILTGCHSTNNNSNNIPNEESTARSISPESEKQDTLQVDTTIEPLVEPSEEPSEEPLSPVEYREVDYSIPDEFVDYRKFIGLDISVLEVDTSIWDSDDFSHDLWEGSCYGHAGTVSVRLGWDNKTMIEFFLTLAEDDKIYDDEMEQIRLSAVNIFGPEKDESSVSFKYFGNSDYEFRVPKPIEQTGCFLLSWNSDILLDYMHSKPKEEPTPTPSAKPNPPKKEEPKIGMTADEVRSSTWGSPSEINKTTTQYGVREQWVYRTYSKTKYIYLEDGFVTAIQE